MENYRAFRRKQSFLHRTFTFSGSMTPSQFWSGLGLRLIGCICGVILVCILIAAVVPGDTEELIAVANIGVSIFGVAWLLPVIPMSRRRLRDGGFSAKTYLWLLLPVIGWIVFVARLCAKSVEVNAAEASDYYNSYYYE